MIDFLGTEVPILSLTAPTLLLVAILMLFRGTLVTRREVDSKDEEIRLLREANKTKDETIASFTESIDAVTDMMEAFLTVAQERRRER